MSDKLTIGDRIILIKDIFTLSGKSSNREQQHHIKGTTGIIIDIVSDNYGRSYAIDISYTKLWAGTSEIALDKEYYRDQKLNELGI